MSRFSQTIAFFSQISQHIFKADLIDLKVNIGLISLLPRVFQMSGDIFNGNLSVLVF